MSCLRIDSENTQLDYQSEIPNELVQDHTFSKKSTLYQVVSQALTLYSRDTSRIPTLICTKDGGFRVWYILPKDIDSDLAVASKLTYSVIKQTLATMSQENQECTMHVLDRLEELQLEAVQDTTPLLKRYIQLIEEAKAENNTFRLPSLFKAVKACITMQEKIYSIYPKAKQTLIENRLQVDYFQELLYLALQIREETATQFPACALPCFYDVIPLFDPRVQELIQNNVSTFLDIQSTEKVIKALRNYDDVWNWFQFASKEAYFEAVVEELSRYNSYDKVPASLLQALRKSRHINVDKLLSLQIFTHSYDDCLTEILSSPSIQALYIGINTPHSFINQHLKTILTTHIDRLSELSLCNQYIIDSLFEDLPPSKLKSFSIYNACFNGSCLQSPFFLSLQSAVFIFCHSLLDENVKNISSSHLKNLVFRCLNEIDGSCLKADCFKNVSSLQIIECPKVTDAHLRQISCEKLEELKIMSLEEIDGSCLKANAFRFLKTLNIQSCSNITDLHLLFLSCTQLETLILKYLEIYGSCLKAPCYSTLHTLEIDFCDKIEDRFLHNLSSAHLKELSLSHLTINGSGLKAPCFKEVERLEISYCEEILDVHLKLFPSNHLKSVTLTRLNVDGTFLNPNFASAKSIELINCSKASSEFLYYFNK